MAGIRILAVEDDELHADNLRMVADKLNYHLLGVLRNGNEVHSMIEATRPDVLLMDIDLGTEIDGVALTAKISETKNIPIIYVTSFRGGDIMNRAIATKPDGYILKPYDAAQLEAVIELAVFKGQNELIADTGNRKTNTLNALFIKEGSSLVKVTLDEIIVVKAFDKYCYIFTRNKKHLLSTQFKNVLPRFPAETFMQVHRSYLINLGAIEKVKPLQNTVEIGGMEIPLSKSYKAGLYNRLVTV